MGMVFSEPAKEFRDAVAATPNIALNSSRSSKEAGYIDVRIGLRHLPTALLLHALDATAPIFPGMPRTCTAQHVGPALHLRRDCAALRLSQCPRPAPSPRQTETTSRCRLGGMSADLLVAVREPYMSPVAASTTGRLRHGNPIQYGKGWFGWLYCHPYRPVFFRSPPVGLGVAITESHCRDYGCLLTSRQTRGRRCRRRSSRNRRHSDRSSPCSKNRWSSCTTRSSCFRR